MIQGPDTTAALVAALVAASTRSGSTSITMIGAIIALAMNSLALLALVFRAGQFSSEVKANVKATDILVIKVDEVTKEVASLAGKVGRRKDDQNE